MSAGVSNEQLWEQLSKNALQTQKLLDQIDAQKRLNINQFESLVIPVDNSVTGLGAGTGTPNTILQSVPFSTINYDTWIGLIALAAGAPVTGYVACRTPNGDFPMPTFATGALNLPAQTESSNPFISGYIKYLATVPMTIGGTFFLRVSSASTITGNVLFSVIGSRKQV